MLNNMRSWINWIMLEFKRNENTLTLGVEMEVQVLDQQTLKLVPRAMEIIRMLQQEKLAKEMFRSTLELITGVCHDLHSISRDLNQTLVHVRNASKLLDVVFAGTGTHPIADYNNRILSASPRYQALLDRNQWLIRRMAVYGLHVHIGMRDGDDCIRYNNFFMHFIPHLIALSASSPFWKGKDTGLAASRPTTYEAHPTSGMPVIVEDWDQFNSLYHNLLQTESIQSIKDIWWDMRPSPGFGTLEIRICDGPATMLELESIVAWIHLLAYWFRDHQDVFYSVHGTKPAEWIMRENKWRSIRFGLQADIIQYPNFQTQNIGTHILQWNKLLQPYIQVLGYEKYITSIENIILRGNSSDRQRRIMSETQDIGAVVDFNIREFEQGQPLWAS